VSPPAGEPLAYSIWSLRGVGLPRNRPHDLTIARPHAPLPKEPHAPLESRTRHEIVVPTPAQPRIAPRRCADEPSRTRCHHRSRSSSPDEMLGRAVTLFPTPLRRKGPRGGLHEVGCARGTTETAAPVAIDHLPRVMRCPADVATLRADPQRPTSEDQPRIDPLRRCSAPGLTPSPHTCSRRLCSSDAEAPAQPFLLRPVPQATQTCIAISAGVATLGAASGSRGACVHDRRWSPERLHHHGSGLAPPPVWSR